jgi:hypothetical protein
MNEEQRNTVFNLRARWLRHIPEQMTDEALLGLYEDFQASVNLHSGKLPEPDRTHYQNMVQPLFIHWLPTQPR